MYVNNKGSDMHLVNSQFHSNMENKISSFYKQYIKNMNLQFDSYLCKAFLCKVVDLK